MTAADFENTNATVCRASPSCPIGVSSATINGDNYCHNCQAINTYEDGYRKRSTRTGGTPPESQGRTLRLEWHSGSRARGKREEPPPGSLLGTLL